MDYSELDNVIWHALNGPQRGLALRFQGLAWYPPAIAPFIAVAACDAVPDLDAALERGFRDPAYVAGVLPNRLPVGWRYSMRSTILQMLPARDIEMTHEEDIRVLGHADRSAMLTLARTALPDFFRERTAELGEYLGCFDGQRLVAMAGERMALDGWREISGVCTHPDFVGRGFARRLTSALRRRHAQRGVASFLHVSEGNETARGLYASMGFVSRASLAFGKIERESTQ
jgi:ribosomal protein S18 acetylase RimI-like enzyme